MADYKYIEAIRRLFKVIYLLEEAAYTQIISGLSNLNGLETNQKKTAICS